MMKWLLQLTPIALVIAKLPLAAAFAPTARSTRVTSMYSIVFEPPIDNFECEESVFAIKKREREQHDDAVKARYLSEYGIELTEADLMDSVDQYQVRCRCATRILSTFDH